MLIYCEELPVKVTFFIAIYVEPDFRSNAEKIQDISTFENIVNACKRIYYYPNNQDGIYS